MYAPHSLSVRRQDITTAERTSSPSKPDRRSLTTVTGGAAAQHLHGRMSLDILGRVGREAAVLAQDIKHPRPHALPCEAFVSRDHGGTGNDQGRAQNMSRRRVVSVSVRERESEGESESETDVTPIPRI